jgi:NADPH2:quinone reductase
MTMQRVTVRAFGGPEQLTVETVTEAPRPRRGQVLIDVEAAGVNYLDVYQRKGLSPVSLPFTLDWRASGGCVRLAKAAPATVLPSETGWHGKKIKQALGRVVAEEHLLHPARLRSFGRAAGKRSFS